jgi:menaquinone-dependent protoporphyrinogen oxidase
MPTILIVYGTGQGQTAKVADHVATLLSVRGHDVTTRNVDDATDVDPAAFDAVLVGASINNQEHQPAVREFVREHRDALDALPSGFFQLSLASAIDWRGSAEGATEWVDDLVETTGWQPDTVGLFAGALRYTEYGLPMRVLFKLAAIPFGLGTDTSRDYEYTDWDAVESWAVAFADRLEPEPAYAGATDPAAATDTEPTPDPRVDPATADATDGLPARRIARLLALGLGVGLAAAYYLTRDAPGRDTDDATHPEPVHVDDEPLDAPPTDDAAPDEDQYVEPDRP